MIAAFSSLKKRAFAGACALCFALAPAAVSAQVAADPVVLYAQMKDAYDKGSADGWTFLDQERYFSTIVNAGRAYSLQNPSDPAYTALATLTVQTATGINYNPLTNHDAAAWYVREAADVVFKTSQDPNLVGAAERLLSAVNAEEDPRRLAQIAYDGATKNVATYPGDANAELQQLEAAWRAYLLTSDDAWYGRALEIANASKFPLANLPTTWGLSFAEQVKTSEENPGLPFHAQATVLYERLDALGKLAVIASVSAISHGAYMSTLAPADEYFGRMGMSILGIENQLKHINFMLDYNYGNRESNETQLVVNAVLGLHEVYPRDRDLPKILLECYTTLQRMNDKASVASASQIRGLLTVEYQDSPEARKLLGTAPG